MKLFSSLFRKSDGQTKKEKKKRSKKKYDDSFMPSQHKSSDGEPFDCSRAECWCRKAVEQRIWLRPVDKQLLEAAFYGTLSEVCDQKKDEPALKNMEQKLQMEDQKMQSERKGSKCASPSPSSTRTVLEQLIARNANPNVFDRTGITALHYAARNCHVRDLKALLKADADPKVADINGNTPLHFLAMSMSSRVATDSSREKNDQAKTDGSQNRKENVDALKTSDNEDRPKAESTKALVAHKEIVKRLAKSKSCQNSIGRTPAGIVQDVLDRLEKYEKQTQQMLKSRGELNPLLQIIQVNRQIRSLGKDFDDSKKALQKLYECLSDDR